MKKDEEEIKEEPAEDIEEPTGAKDAEEEIIVEESPVVADENVEVIIDGVDTRYPKS
jgi:hypothetical protein